MLSVSLYLYTDAGRVAPISAHYIFPYYGTGS